MEGAGDLLIPHAVHGMCLNPGHRGCEEAAQLDVSIEERFVSI